jgi:hypothetical protein
LWRRCSGEPWWSATITVCSGSLKVWRGLRGIGQLAMGGSRGRSSRVKGIGRRDSSKTGGTAAASSAGVVNRQRGGARASSRRNKGGRGCRATVMGLALLIKWCDGGDNGRGRSCGVATRWRGDREGPWAQPASAGVVAPTCSAIE